MNGFAFPDKTRQQLELDLQLMTAALYLAAVSAVGCDSEAIVGKLREWVEAAPEVAVRAGVIRRARDLAAFEGVIQ